jgi:hypothetical protein
MSPAGIIKSGLRRIIPNNGILSGKKPENYEAAAIHFFHD